MFGKSIISGLSFLILCSQIRAQPFECVMPEAQLYYAIHNKKGKITDCQKTVVLGIEDRDSCRVILHVEYFFRKNWKPVTGKNGMPLEPDSTEVIWSAEGIISDVSQFSGGLGYPHDQEMRDYLTNRGYEYHFQSTGSPDFVYPDQMIVGDTLCRYTSEDWCIKVATGKRALSQFFFDAVVYVASREKIHTAAGEFDCYKIVADVGTRIKSLFYNPIERHRFVQWLACGIGPVLLGEEDKKGRLMDYMELVKIEWPGEHVSQTNQ